ncbi:hypothetical protein L484_003188 [Morus notabilis]|uniref:Uncharacterized protein n=1 Tax=Morus notabilis TaxID=981085 RepID=W9R572_9ROSA|nr:hypothetical protein L484_003188 [Morus notabilis]
MGTDCSIYGQVTENEHLFFECRFANLLCYSSVLLLLKFRRECWGRKSILDRVEFVIKPPSEADFSKEGSFLFPSRGANEVAHGAVLQDNLKVLALYSKGAEEFKRNFDLGNTENGGRYFEQKDYLIFLISLLMLMQPVVQRQQQLGWSSGVVVGVRGELPSCALQRTSMAKLSGQQLCHVQCRDWLVGESGGACLMHGSAEPAVDKPLSRISFTLAAATKSNSSRTVCGDNEVDFAFCWNIKIMKSLEIMAKAIDG